ncbi:MAG: glycerol-3-phosphate acyltransferase [Bacillota bacterium]|nr:glycerol-3-phosphate acyltransferase [Bacillota bacterium]
MNNILWMKYISWIIVGYLSGSVLYGYLIPKYINHVDVCQISDDSNPGTANAFKYAGFLAGSTVILCELLKAFIPVFFAARHLDINRLPFALVMAAPVAGHAFSIFFKGKGGKAIAASFGVVLALYPNLFPLAALIVLYILFSTVIVISPHLYRSIVTFFLFTVAVYLVVPVHSLRLGCGIISAITILKHLMSRDEETISIRLFHHALDKS